MDYTGNGKENETTLTGLSKISEVMYKRFRHVWKKCCKQRLLSKIVLLTFIRHQRDAVNEQKRNLNQIHI